MFMHSVPAPEAGQNQNSQNRSPQVLEALIRRIAEGDVSAFETLYRSTDQMLYAYILSIAGNPHDAQDLMQDVYLKIRSGAHRYTPLGKPMAWIFTIAKNLAFMKVRNGQRTTAADPEELEGFSAEKAESPDSWEDALVLREAMGLLSAEERQIVFLHAISGMKHREIAAMTVLPLSTVLSKYVRSLAKLKKHLSKMGVEL